MSKIIIDMTSVNVAFGKDTTYWAGIIDIDGSEISCDGCNDRSNTPNDIVWNILSNSYINEYPFIDDAIGGKEFQEGYLYEITVEKDKVDIKEIRMQELKIKIRSSLSKERLDELIKFIDAQLMEDNEGEDWSDDFTYEISLNGSKW